MVASLPLGSKWIPVELYMSDGADAGKGLSGARVESDSSTTSLCAASAACTFSNTGSSGRAGGSTVSDTVVGEGVAIDSNTGPSGRADGSTVSGTLLGEGVVIASDTGPSGRAGVSAVSDTFFGE